MFMKIIKTILSSFLAFGLIVSTGIFIFFQTFDTDQYLPQITKKASLVLGRPVSITGVGLGLSSQGITLDLGPLVIADDTAFTKQPFIKVDKVRLSLDLIALILHREIHITEILLQSPQIHFIRSLERNINAQSIGRSLDIKPPFPPSVSVAAAPLRFVARPPGIKESPETIKLIRIQDASISFIDQNQTFPLDIWLTNINANINNFSLSKPFQLKFEASLYNNASNVEGQAQVFLDISKRSIQISDMSLGTDLSQIDIDGLRGISPGMSVNPIFNNLTGVVQLSIAHLEFGVSKDIAATGDVTITNGVIKDFNIIKTILSHTLGVFGGMGINIDNLISGQLKSTLGGADTVIKKADVKFSLHDKAVFIDDSLVQTNIFEVTAKGSVDPGLNMGLQTILHLDNDISTVLVDQFDGLKLLCDDSKRITIGASLTGVIPHLKYKPNKDFRKKSTRALMEEGGNILGILLGRGQTSPQGQASFSQDGKKIKKNFKNIFKSLLQ